MMYENKNVCEKSVSFVTYNECPFFGYLGQILLEKKYECFQLLFRQSVSHKKPIKNQRNKGLQPKTINGEFSWSKTRNFTATAISQY